MAPQPMSPTRRISAMSLSSDCGFFGMESVSCPSQHSTKTEKPLPICIGRGFRISAGLSALGGSGLHRRLFALLSPFERRAQHDLLIIQPGGRQSLVPRVESAARSGYQRDIELLHALRIEVFALRVQLLQPVDYGLLAPLAITANVAILQPGRRDGISPGAEVLSLCGRGRQLRIDLRAHVTP